MKERKDKSPTEIKEVLEMFGRYGSIVYAESEADRLAKKALQGFEDVSRAIPESELKETARDAIIKLVSRHK